MGLRVGAPRWNVAPAGVDVPHLLDAVDQRDADAAHLSVDQHFAGTAFADAAVEASVATVETVAVNGKTGLVKGGGDGIAFRGFNFLTFILKTRHLPLGNVDNRMMQNGTHSFQFLIFLGFCPQIYKKNGKITKINVKILEK